MQFIMLIGPSGSGKSTLAEDLVSRDPDTVILSSDRIVETYAEQNGISYQEAYPIVKMTAGDQLKAEAEAAFSAGRNVIWDQTNLEREDREQKLALVPDDYVKTAVAFEGDYATLLHRIQNRRDGGEKEIPGYVLRAQMHVYALPDHDEGFDRVMVKTIAPHHEEAGFEPSF